jgi:hypothetical protein
MTKQIIYAVTLMVCFVLVMIIIVNAAWLFLYFVQYWAPITYSYIKVVNVTD